MKAPIRDRPGIDLSKSRGIDLNKPEAGSFDAGSKPSQGTVGLPKLGITGTRELGSIGGITATGDATAYVPLPTSLQLEINPVEQSVKAGVGFDLGRVLGLEIGGEIKRTPTGGISVENASFGVNVLGFGVSAEGKGSESSKLGVSAFGVSVEVANDKDGKISTRIGFSLPGISTGVTFAPDGEMPGADTGSGVVAPQTQPGIAFPAPAAPKGCNKGYVSYTAKSYLKLRIDSNDPVAGYTKTYEDVSIATRESDLKKNNPDLATLSNSGVEEYLADRLQPCTYFFLENTKPIRYYRGSSPSNTIEISESASEASGANIMTVTSSYYIRTGETYVANGNIINRSQATFYRERIGVGDDNKTLWSGWLLGRFTYYYLKCVGDTTPTKMSPINLPNYPQKYKPMDCCDKIEEIHKYLGIGRFKKNKFKLSNAFLVPGGKGETAIEDYYELTEALFRMLANGLIINPESSPNGTPWKVANASAWAAQMYEMAAESMSDGNSSQKVEIASMMQLTQIMKVLAELTRKVEFVADVLGVTPDIKSEDVPVCFTIYEGHKGFGKKDKKVIDVTAAKTDEQVENTILKMLNPSKIPITKWEFKSDSISIAAALSRL